MTVARWVFRSVLGLASVVTLVAPARADPPTRQVDGRQVSATERTSDAVVERSILDWFSDLDADATRQRLEELRSDRTLSEHLSALASKLAAPGTVAADVEASVLPLVEGRTEEDADLTLAAIMLDQYQSTLKAGLLAGERQSADVAKLLVDRDALLTTAAYGRTRRLTQADRRRQMRR